MQFSTIVSFALAAVVAADDETVTSRSTVTRVLTQHTTFVPAAVTFLANIHSLNNDTSSATTSPEGASAAAPVATGVSNSTGSGSNSTSNSTSVAVQSASSSAKDTGVDVANAAAVPKVAGMTVIFGAAALLL